MNESTIKYLNEALTRASEIVNRELGSSGNQRVTLEIAYLNVLVQTRIAEALEALVKK